MTLDRGGRRHGLEPALSDERRRLIYRYMEDGTGLEDDDVLDEASEEQAQEVEASGPHYAAEATVTRLPPPEPRQSASLRAISPVPASPNDGESRARRGRPPGRKARRQVHFHVDAEQDRMLLAAAGRFGSQQKALIAALHSLHEVPALRHQVEQLHGECERQRRLLAEAQALFRSSGPSA